MCDAAHAKTSNHFRNEAHYKSTVHRLMTKFETTGLVSMIKSPGQKCSCQLSNGFFLCKIV